MSEYTPTNWQSGDIATAARFNELEQGVGAMSAGYTPHVWQDGDVPTAAQMNALEQAVAAGGGGSSDFSTAEVTVIGDGGLTGFYPPSFPCLLNDALVGSADLQDSNMQTYTVPLYKGEAVGTCWDQIVAITGDMTFDSETSKLHITGNSSITVRPE